MVCAYTRPKYPVRVYRTIGPLFYSKGPKYRFPSYIDVNRCWEAIAMSSVIDGLNERVLSVMP